MSKHDELVQANSLLIELDTIIDGQEGLLTDIFSSVGDHALVGAKIVGGAAVDGLVKLFRNANSSLARAFGSNQTVIDQVYKQMTTAEKEGDDIEVKLTPAFLAKITANGKQSDISDSINALHDTLKALDKHRLDVEAFYQKELSLFKDFRSIKDTESAISLIKKLDDLKYPVPNFKHKENSMLISDLLPGGKEFVFNTTNSSYSVKNEDVTGENNDDTLSKADIVNILKRLEDLDAIFKVIHKANDNYVQYLGKFNTVVKEAFAHVDNLKGDISSSLVRDLLSRLEGNPHVFAFYTGFLPKVVNYVDGYVADVSGYFSKQFN